MTTYVGEQVSEATWDCWDYDNQNPEWESIEALEREGSIKGRQGIDSNMLPRP